MSTKKKTIEDCRAAAQKRNGKCLSKDYDGCKNKLQWECEHKHTWWASFDSISHGSWCRKCNSLSNIEKSLEIGLSVAQKCATENNGRCLSTEFKGRSEPLTWECEEGHTWDASLYSIKYGGSWCQRCYLKALSEKLRSKNGLKEARQLAADRNGECLSEEFINNHEKMIWKCEKNHIWKTSLVHVKFRHQWCSRCYGKRNKTQNLVKTILENILGRTAISGYREFAWQVYPDTGCKFELDIYFEELKMAFEFDGEYHFMPIKFSKSMTDEEAINRHLIQVKRDKNKDKIVNEHKDDVKTFIRINYKDDLSTNGIIIILKKHGVLL